jgi:hypothetical protein
MKLCDVVIGLNNGEWNAIVSYENGKVTELHHADRDELFLAITKELDELED